MNADEAMRRGVEARQVLESAAYQAAWEAYEARIFDAFAKADIKVEEMVRLQGLLVASRKARAHLERLINEGALAAHELELTEKRNFMNRFRIA